MQNYESDIENVYLEWEKSSNSLHILKAIKYLRHYKIHKNK